MLEKALLIIAIALPLLGALDAAGDHVAAQFETVSEAMATDSDCRGLGAFKCQ